MVRVHCDPPGRKPEWVPAAKAAETLRFRKEHPTRCEKALKEKRFSERGDSHRGESPKYLDNCTVK